MTTEHIEDEKMEKNVDMEDESSEKDTDESGEEDEVAEDQIEGNEKLNFDFEALPPHSEDINQIANLLTQIFLRTDIDFEGLSKAIVEQSPLGCVFRTTEDCADEDDEDAVYGVSSVVPLTGAENFRIGELLIPRAKKHSDKSVVKPFEQLFDKNLQTKFGLIINERMLHFPAKIAGPTLNALKNDIQSTKSLREIEKFIIILKVRFNEEEINTGAGSSSSKPKGKAKKRAVGNKLSKTEAVYDNTEEELLFQVVIQCFFVYNANAYFLGNDQRFSVLPIPCSF